MYIVLAILIFGILIAIHEFGHFIAAKLSGVRVLEFAIGMGPALVKKKKGETLYAWRLLPIGGFCAMEGEDQDTGDPRAFITQPFWKKFIILVAGAAMNFLLGLLIVLLLYSGAKAFSSSTIESFEPDCPYQGENALLPGDRIVSIDGHRVFYAANFLTYMEGSTTGNHDLVLLRDGARVRLSGYHMVPVEFEVDGQSVMKYGVNFALEPASFGAVLRYSWCNAIDFVRLVWMGLRDLVTGAVGLSELSGVVGIVGVIHDVGQQSQSIGAALYNIAYLSAFIAVNLAVMNLLPIPALDGGRIFFLLIDLIVLAVTRRRLNPKFEGYVNAGGFALLMALMIFVMYNDIARLIK